MIANGLVTELDQLVTSPTAIPLLRRFVLDLATHGRLVPQTDSDGSALGILAAAKLVADSSPRRSGRGNWPQPLRLEVEPPYPVPSSWTWATLGELADFSAGRTPSRHDPSYWNTGDYAWVAISDMPDGGVVGSTRETISEKARRTVFGSDPLPAGALLMSFKLTIGKIARLGIPAFHNEAIISIRPRIAELEPYLFVVLPLFARQGRTKNAVKGKTLNRRSISNILLPLPPLPEQGRIVARLEEIMSVCADLELALSEVEARRANLLHHRLSRAIANGSRQ